MSEQFFSQSHKAVQSWSAMVTENLDRIGKACEEVARMEARYYEGAHKAVDEYARLIKESLGYTAKLSVEMRNSVLEATRRGVDALQATATVTTTTGASAPGGNVSSTVSTGTSA